MKNSIQFLILCLLLFGCQINPKPTTVSSTSSGLNIEAIYSLEEPVMITEDTVVLDARPFYAYTTGHLPMAYSLQPTDFTQRAPGLEGLLQTDLEAIARRLALLGVHPERPVVVVGGGVDGGGEEGYLAWIMSYLGVESVQHVPIDYFNIKHTTQEPPAPENAQYWKPKPQKNLIVSRQEIISVISKPSVDPSTYILDVRSETEYLQRGGGAKKWPDIGAINVNWTEFFDDEGRPEVSLVQRLSAVGITPDKRIIVISDRGYRSGAVTLALKELGYSKAGNYTGGYSALVAQTPGL